jgi:hypothetical protein
VDVETGDLLTVRDVADVPVALLHLLPNFDAIGANLVEFLKIRMILVENTPKLKVD